MSDTPDSGHPDQPGIGYGSDRWWPERLGGVVYLILLAATLLGVAVVTLWSWRWGTRLIGGALVAGGAARLILPGAHAGMLAVRPRLLDVPMLILLGASILVLSVSIPEQPS